MALINEILDISKIEAGKMQLNNNDFDLNVLIDNLTRLFEIHCQQKQLQWAVKGFDHAVLVHGDEIKLRQVLINLLGNAVKFTDSGKITFMVTALEDDQYRFDTIDTGSGIPFEAQATIFDAFQQEESGAKHGGTGLGLAISKKQLELMGSDLLLKSEFNEGAHFYFTLVLPPAKKDLVQQNKRLNTVLHLAPQCKITALVVDDVKENRDVLSKLLLDIGVEIIVAKDGKEAVEQTREHLPDIVFMDMRMPVMRGEDAVKIICEEFGKDRIKLVAITASTLDQRRDFYLELGCHEYISKPFEEEEIFSSLEELLNVEFVYEDHDTAQDEPAQLDKLDLARMSIPEDLYGKLKDSAELYNVTNLEKYLIELEKGDEASKQLSEHLKYLANSYDMEAILKILESVSTT